MFVGHYALALAAKRVAPMASLGTLFAAVQLADLLWPLFLLLGWERSSIVPAPNPFLRLSLDSISISHSLLTLIGWGCLFALLDRKRTGHGRGALLVALAVVSHWLLDFVTHRPDMPLYPGGPLVGLGLWYSVGGTVVVESVMLVAGVWLYVRATSARDGVGRYGFWGLMSLLVLSYASSLLAAPPPLRAIAIFGIVFGWLFVAGAGWVDGHRDTALPDNALPDAA